jgi:hypothetical protein
MAHSSLHFALGMAAGAAASARPLLRAWLRDEPVSGPFRRWFLTSLAGGTFAVFPSILGRLGVPPPVCESPLMNVFLLHHWIDRVKPGATTMGPILLGAAFAAQYALLVLAVFRAGRRTPVA